MVAVDEERAAQGLRIGYRKNTAKNAAVSTIDQDGNEAGHDW